MYGYAGQGYPLYGQPPGSDPGPRRDREPNDRGEPGARRQPQASRHPSFLRGGGGTAEDEQRARRQSEMPWHSDPSSSAFAFGYTTSLGASHPPPSSQRGHSGKGPKDYLRADSRIREDVCDRLTDDDTVDASEIHVDVKSGEVTLTGTVLDRYGKRRAEDLAASVRGVIDVRNELRVNKGLLRELGEELVGDTHAEHHGHHGEGPR